MFVGMESMGSLDLEILVQKLDLLMFLQFEKRMSMQFLLEEIILGLSWMKFNFYEKIGKALDNLRLLNLMNLKKIKVLTLAQNQSNDPLLINTMKSLQRRKAISQYKLSIQTLYFPTDS